MWPISVVRPNGTVSSSAFLSSSSRKDRLRALQVAKDQVLLLFKEKASLKPTTMPGGVLPPHDGSGPMHIAFAIQTTEVGQWEMHLAKHGVAIESRVHWGENDESLYFRDPDGHALELISGDQRQKLPNS